MTIDWPQMYRIGGEILSAWGIGFIVGRLMYFFTKMGEAVR